MTRGGAGDFFPSLFATPHPRRLMTPQSFYNYSLLIVLTANLNTKNKHFKKKGPLNNSDRALIIVITTLHCHNI